MACSKRTVYMGAYYGRKYKGLAIVGYIICAAVIAYLAIIVVSLIDSAVHPEGDNAQLGTAIGYVLFVVMALICAGIQIVPTALGITGWILTKKSGKTALMYIILTFLPLVSVGILWLAAYFGAYLPTQNQQTAMLALWLI